MSRIETSLSILYPMIHLLTRVATFTTLTVSSLFHYCRPLRPLSFVSLLHSHNNKNTIPTKTLTTTTTLSYNIIARRNIMSSPPSPTKKIKADDTTNSTSTKDNTDRMDDVTQDKKELRKLVRSKLKLLSKEEINKQSKQVWERLFELERYKNSRSIGLFLSMPKNEINTDILIQDALRQQKTIYVPQVGKNFEHADMELLQVIVKEQTSSSTDTTTDTTTDNDTANFFHKQWPKNKWGIPEPPTDMPIIPAKPGDIDILIVPGLAFDLRGNRLGQGKGYYDRFIAKMLLDRDNNNNNETAKKEQQGETQLSEHTKPKPLFLVSVGLESQLVESVPMAEYDRKMDMVLLPNQTIVM